jgi:hypothetical protein
MNYNVHDYGHRAERWYRRTFYGGASERFLMEDSHQGRQPVRMSDWKGHPIDTGRNPADPFAQALQVLSKWYSQSLGLECGPKDDDALKAELTRGNADDTNCTLHVNGAWDSTFENMTFVLAPRFIAILLNAFHHDGRGALLQPFSLRVKLEEAP